DSLAFSGGHSLVVKLQKPAAEAQIVFCKLYKLALDYSDELSLSFASLLEPAYGNLISVYFDLQSGTGDQVERHEIIIPSSPQSQGTPKPSTPNKIEWCLRNVSLDVGKDPDGAGQTKLVELGVAFCFPEAGSLASKSDCIVRFGEIALSNLGKIELPLVSGVKARDIGNNK